MPPISGSPRPPRQRLREPFLKGPIPWAWLDRAGQLPGKALATGLVVWRQAGLRRAKTIHLCLAQLCELGLNEDSARRGIRALERARLISVGRRPGRGLDITINDIPDALPDDRETNTRPEDLGPTDERSTVCTHTGASVRDTPACTEGVSTALS
jgi:hypothetical protein